MNKLDAAAVIGKHIKDGAYDQLNWTLSYQEFIVQGDVDVTDDLVCGYVCKGTACGKDWDDYDFHIGTGGEFTDAQFVVSELTFQINSESDVLFTDSDFTLKNMIVYEVENDS